jgi:hypothetical protein
MGAVSENPLHVSHLSHKGDAMRDLDSLFAALAASRFRARFRLGEKELAYLRSRGLPAILDHAAAFVRDRLAPEAPANDGRQTPMRGHPVFIAQHATATCCRSCLAKWHRIPEGRPLAEDEQAHVVATIRRWLEPRIGRADSAPTLPGLRQPGLDL